MYVYAYPLIMFRFPGAVSFGRLEQLDDRARAFLRQAFRHHRVDRKSCVAGTCAYAPRKGERLVETRPQPVKHPA